MTDQPPTPPTDEPLRGAHLRRDSDSPPGGASPDDPRHLSSGTGGEGSLDPAGDAGGEGSLDLAGEAGGEGSPDPAGDMGGGGVATPVEPPRRQRRALPWIVIIAVAAVIAVVVRVFFVQTFFVPSVSMYPTLQVNDRMLVLKTGYTIQRGAVMVFRHPPHDTTCGGGQDDLVKRVIGLPGETIWSAGNTVYIDGKPLAEPWLPKNDPLGQPIVKQTIPPNEYFMMGDNRSDSCDSRVWGDLPRSLMVGRVFLVIWRNGHPVFDVI